MALPIHASNHRSKSTNDDGGGIRHRARFSSNGATTEIEDPDWLAAELAEDTCECGRLMGGNGG